MFLLIEGTDSSGKSTQTALLIKALQEQGKDVEKLKFPAYETPFGEMVARYLRGEFGKLNEVSPEVASLLYTVDRYQFKDSLFKKLREEKILVADRYLQSNIAYQGAKFSGEEKTKFVDWMKSCESRLPKVDAVVFLNMPAEAAEQLMNAREDKEYNKGLKKDIHEEDKKYQDNVRAMYLEQAKNDGWIVIQCAEKKGNSWNIKSIDAIHAEIMARLKPLIG